MFFLERGSLVVHFKCSSYDNAIKSCCYCVAATLFQLIVFVVVIVGLVGKGWMKYLTDSWGLKESTKDCVVCCCLRRCHCVILALCCSLRTVQQRFKAGYAIRPIMFGPGLYVTEWPAASATKVKVTVALLIIVLIVQALAALGTSLAVHSKQLMKKKSHLRALKYCSIFVCECDSVSEQ